MKKFPIHVQTDKKERKKRKDSNMLIEVTKQKREELNG
jgi:hypothetical protein